MPQRERRRRRNASLCLTLFLSRSSSMSASLTLCWSTVLDQFTAGACDHTCSLKRPAAVCNFCGRRSPPSLVFSTSVFRSLRFHIHTSGKAQRQLCLLPGSDAVSSSATLSPPQERLCLFLLSSFLKTLISRFIISPQTLFSHKICSQYSHTSPAGPSWASSSEERRQRRRSMWCRFLHHHRFASPARHLTLSLYAQPSLRRSAESHNGSVA